MRIKDGHPASPSTRCEQRVVIGGECEADRFGGNIYPQIDNERRAGGSPPTKNDELPSVAQRGDEPPIGEHHQLGWCTTWLERRELALLVNVDDAHHRLVF